MVLTERARCPDAAFVMQRGGLRMLRFVGGAVAIAVLPWSPVHAQGASVNELKGKIFDARMTQKTFANGLRFCQTLDGKNFFYFAPRNRVLNLEDYHRSLDSLARERVFNPETRRPWSPEDAAARWERVQQEAVKNKADCELVASLPELEKQLQELQTKSEAAPSK